jgi:WD40 repeat protein
MPARRFFSVAERLLDYNSLPSGKKHPLWRQIIRLPILSFLICLLPIQASNAYGALNNLVMDSQFSLLIGDSSEEKILFWSLDSGKLEYEIALRYKEWVDEMVLSHDQNYLAVTLFKSSYNVGLSYTIGCYSIKERRWLWKNSLDESTADSSIQFTEDDAGIVFVGLRESAIYDVPTGTVLKRENSPSKIKKGYSCLSPTGKYLAVWGPTSGHNDDFFAPWDYLKPKWAFVYDIEKKETILEITKWLKPFKYCGGTFSSDEQYLLLGSANGIVLVWSIKEGKVVRGWRANGDSSSPFKRGASSYGIHSLTLSPDGRFLATMELFKIKIWNFSNNNLLKVFNKLILGIEECSQYPMVFSRDGKLFALKQNESLCLYDTETWNKKWCVPRPRGE